MRNIITFNQLANAAIEKNAMHHRTKSAGGMERKLNFNAIKQNLGDLIYKLSSQKFEDPAEGEEALTAKFQALNKELKDAFQQLDEEYSNE